MPLKRKSKFSIKIILGIVLLMFVLIGAGVAFCLSTQSQDIRNQAAGRQNTGNFCINTPRGTLQHGQKVAGSCGDIQLSGQSPDYTVGENCQPSTQTFYACNNGKLVTVCRNSSSCASDASCGDKDQRKCLKTNHCAWIADKGKCANKRDKQEEMKHCYQLCNYSAGCTCPSGCEKTSVNAFERCSSY